MPSSQYDCDRPVSIESLFDSDRSQYALESILPVILAALDYLSKATKTSQLNDYLLTFNKQGPKKWIDMQLEEQNAGEGPTIFSHSPGIEYKGEASDLTFKPLLVERERCHC